MPAPGPAGFDQTPSTGGGKPSGPAPASFSALSDLRSSQIHLAV